MTEITLRMDEDIFAALRRSPDEFVRELRLAAAIHWYERGEISQESESGQREADRGNHPRCV
jgi:hypothetical protein